jgi:hypothetical protein
MKTIVSWNAKKAFWKKKYLGPKRPLSSFGPDVVGLRRLVAIVDVGVGVGVVMAGGDGIVAVVEVWGSGRRCWRWWSLQTLRCRSGVWKNDKNGKWKWKWKWSFWQKRGKGSIFEKWPFLGWFSISFWCSFLKNEIQNEIKNEPKMVQKCQPWTTLFDRAYDN